MEKVNADNYTDIPKAERVRNAAAYVRVSTDSEKQLHSFDSQKEYWEEKIAGDPKLKFAGIWADEGISGHSVLRRKGFKDMVECAKAGAIDIIFVKSVSRFGRNFIDILQAVRQLRDEHGVVIYFEEENLYSDDPTADMILSMRAMIAEQELKDMSDNQKWSIRKRFKQGIPNNNGRMYGYRLEGEGGVRQLTPIPEEAEIVRLIYEMYISGLGISAIAKELTERGIPSAYNKKAWRDGVISGILRNEKMTGDSILQKIYTENYKAVKNADDNPDAPRVLVEDSHEGIIDKETFNTVQRLMAERSNKKLVGKKQVTRVFTGIIECGICHTNFRHKIYQYKGKGLYGLWACGTYLQHGKSACCNHSIKDSALHEAFVSAFNEFVDTKANSDGIREDDTRLKELKSYSAELYRMMSSGFINQISYITKNEKVRQEIEGLNKEINKKSQDNLYKAFKKKITEYDETAVTRFLQKAIVQDWTVAFIFNNGVTVTRNYTNGTSGNKTGWKDRITTEIKEEE